MNNAETPSLLPPNRTAAEKALAQTVARVSDVPVPNRALWNPDTCPLELLPWLAWALDVREWDSDWSEATRRQVIRQSVAVHRIAGTRAALEQALAPFVSDLDIREWWESDIPGKPHTFELTALQGGGVGGSAATQEQIHAIVQRVKPARSHYRLDAIAAFESSITAKNYGQIAVIARGTWSAGTNN